MDTLNKKQAIKIIKESINFQATIEYIQNSFTMNTKGDLMPKQEKQISLKSIYELMTTKFNSIKTDIKDFKNEVNKRFDSIETDIKNIKTEIKDIKDDIWNIKADINTLKQLPTIAKELNI